MISKLKYLKYSLRVIYKNWKEEKEHYSQHNEDLLVKGLLKNVKSFVDIGANDGVLFSNTYKFAKNGSKGLCIEASPKAYRKLVLNHLLHPRVKCLKCTLSDKIETVYFEEKGYEGVLSNITKDKNKSTFKTKTKLWSDIVSSYPEFRNVDLISLDVEGHELEVLSSFSSNTISSKILIIETDKIEKELLYNLDFLKDYEPKYTNNVNTIFLNRNTTFPTINPLPLGFFTC